MLTKTKPATPKLFLGTQTSEITDVEGVKPCVFRLENTTDLKKKTTRYHLQPDRNFNIHICNNLKSHPSESVWIFWIRDILPSPGIELIASGLSRSLVTILSYPNCFLVAKTPYYYTIIETNGWKCL